MSGVLADKAMHTIEEFNQLTHAAQFLYIWEHCYYLAERKDEEPGLVKLYQVGELFVEIHFRSPSEFEVVRAFRDPVFLLPYLDQLNLDDLFN